MEQFKILTERTAIPIAGVLAICGMVWWIADLAGTINAHGQQIKEVDTKFLEMRFSLKSIDDRLWEIQKELGKCSKR